MALTTQAWLTPIAHRIAGDYLESRYPHGRYPKAYEALVEEKFAEALFNAAEEQASVIDTDDPLHEFLEEERLDAAVENLLDQNVSAVVPPLGGTTGEGRRA